MYLNKYNGMLCQALFMPGKGCPFGGWFGGCEWAYINANRQRFKYLNALFISISIILLYMHDGVYVYFFQYTYTLCY